MLRTLDCRLSLESTGERTPSGMVRRGLRGNFGVSASIRDAAWLASRGYNSGTFVTRHKVEYSPCETLTAKEYARRVKNENSP